LVIDGAWRKTIFLLTLKQVFAIAALQKTAHRNDSFKI